MNTAIPTAERLRQAIEQAQKQEPEFTTHVVENAYDWTEWVCPDPDSYLMKCCDCGLVHEVQFKVVRYRSETEREDCDFVDDPNVQAVFRMRRSEQWSSEDMAHRAGGLPMEQAQKQEPVAWLIVHKSTNERFLTTHSNNWDDMDWFKHPLYTSPPPRQWVGLTNEELRKIWYDDSPVEGGTYIDKLRQVETKIKEKNT